MEQNTTTANIKADILFKTNANFFNLLSPLLFIATGFKDIYKHEQKKYGYYHKGRECVNIGFNLHFSHIVYLHRQGFEGIATGKIGDNKVINRKGKRHYKSGKYSR